MIQRIQTLWYFLSALVMGLLFYFPVYKYPGISELTIGNNFVGIILAAASILLSILAIFNYKKRKNQIALSWLNILVCAGLLAVLFYAIDRAGKLPAHINTDGYYWVGAFIPLIVIILLFLAKAGVKQDEKLIKSMDRLR